MKLTDFVAQYLVVCGVRHAFVLQGGAALHLIDSIDKNNSIKSVAMQHEQACAMAADGYARASNGLGCTIVTSGPGATNLLTGIACSYFDSIPTIHITGNVASFRQSDNLGVRQYGFQETNIVKMAKPICKYAVRIASAEAILIELPKAIGIALSGRKGPVLIDIPDDFQRVELDDDLARQSLLSSHLDFKLQNPPLSIEKLNLLFRDFFSASRPIVILGAGIVSEKSKIMAKEFCLKNQLPYLITWPLKGISSFDDELNLGTFGTHSFRGNNIILQNANYILTVGCRLDSRATAKLDTFARESKIAMVDIDFSEMDKFKHIGLNINYKILADSHDFFLHALTLDDVDLRRDETEKLDWMEYIKSIQDMFNRNPEYNLSDINPYAAIVKLSSFLSSKTTIVADTGTCLPLIFVYGREKEGQKYLSSFNNTPMGYALPAAIGAALASSSREKIIVLAGDGGMQMNIQELATLSLLGLPLIVIVFNNAGHSMIKQTQDDWLDSNYIASSVENGLPKVAFHKVASAYGVSSYQVKNETELVNAFDCVFNDPSPSLIELIVNPDFRYEPIIKYGSPLEYMSPEIDREKIDNAMIVSTCQK